MASLNPSAKRVKIRFNQAPVDSVSDDASSEPSQFEFSTPSPNHMKATSNPDAKKESSQASFCNSESSFDTNNLKERKSDSRKPSIVSFRYIKPVENSRRVLSLKSNRPLKKKSSRIAPFPNLADIVMPHQEGNESDNTSISSSSYGLTSSKSSCSSEENGEKRREAEIRKTLKKSRSIRLGSLRKPNSRIAKSRFDASPNYLKATSCSEGKKTQFQASVLDSESSIDESNRNSNNSKPNSGFSSLKSVQTLRRTPSLRPLRILMNKKPSFKSNRPSVKKCSQVFEDSSINRATCSSTLKDSKFPHHALKDSLSPDLYPGERESERISELKVCRYNYCSLHGHHHSSAPPLKRLLSKRRRIIKTQKSMKLRNQSSQTAKFHSDIMELVDTSEMVINGEVEAILPGGKEEDSALSVEISSIPKMEFLRRPTEGNEDADVAEVIFSETLYPEKGIRENLNQARNFVVAEVDNLERDFAHKETAIEWCCIDNNSSPLSTQPDDNEMREVTEDNRVTSSASVSHTMEALSEATDAKNEELAADNETVGQFAPVEDSEQNSSPCEVHKSQLQQRQHMSLWHLIHQHMVSGGAETLLVDGDNKEKQLNETNRLPVPQTSSSSGFSDSDQNGSNENDDTDKQEIELHKMHAIKIVRDAIEKILLPEVQDQSPDDQSISSDISSEQELFEKDRGEVGNLSNSNSESDKISGHNQEVSVIKEGEEKAEKKTPKNWSNLKKLILLKRFIKALEKVRKVNPRKPQHLPLEPDPEAEKVFLKQPVLDKKKSSEEWMLDYALQQVVSELAPTQKRKVELLIKAFETVVPPSDEQLIQVTFPKFKGMNREGSFTESEQDECGPEATYRDTTVEDIVTSKLDNGVKNSIITEEQSTVPVVRKEDQEIHEERIPNFNLEHLKDDSASSGQPMKVDGLSGEIALPYVTEGRTVDANDTIITSASDNGPFKQLDVVGEVKNGDSGSSEHITTTYNQKSVLNELCKEGDPESNGEKLEIGNLTGTTDEPPSETLRPTSDDMAEAATDNTMISTACDRGPVDELIEAGEQKNGDSEVDNESIEGFDLVRDSEPDNLGHEAHKTGFQKAKNVSMWHLIHQHMVEGLAVEGSTKSLDKENEEHMGDANPLAAAECSGSCPDFCDSFQNKGMDYYDTVGQEVERRKNFAIKLVREAIEKILLPEVQDQSSDDQSVTSETISDQEPIEKSHDEGTSADFSKSSLDFNSNNSTDDVSLSQEGPRILTANISESENEKTASELENKSDKKTPKGWSNLKKLILLRRFVKELEKVKKFNPKKPRHLPLQPDPEAEEVTLRHQMMDGRKSAEEWMLDYALRKVVGELAPKQKRKVALLVKAFETVAPLPEPPQMQVTIPEFKDTNHECCCGESEQEKLVCKVTEADIKTKDIGTSNLDDEGNHSTTTDEKYDVAVDEEDHKEAHQDTVSIFHLEFLKHGSKSTGQNMKLDDLGGVNVDLTESAAPDGSGEPKATYNIASSASDSEPLEQVIDAKEKKKGDSETDLAYKARLEKKKQISMWHLLCQHVVSDIATKVESQLGDGEDEDEQVDGAKTSLQIRRNGSFQEDDNCGKENEDSSSQRIGFSQRDAVQLVRDAIEEILSPEIQDDSSDAQSIANDVNTEEIQEKNNRNDGEPSISTSTNSPKDNFREYKNSEREDHNIINREEKGFEARDIPNPDDQRGIAMVGNKSDQQKPKNWSKLKKLILLKRSIKALEKARKSSFQPPQNLPLKPDTEEEKVDLRHQSKEEKKKAEEWMLDYALQHMVTKLTPARKRRVSILVEAFEAVVPLPGV